MSAGNWEAGQQRDASNPGLAPAGSDDDNNDDAEVFGDFEDVELGLKIGAECYSATAAALTAISDEAVAQKRDAARAAKKAAFDEAYDQGTGDASPAGGVVCMQYAVCALQETAEVMGIPDGTLLVSGYVRHM